MSLRNDLASFHVFWPKIGIGLYTELCSLLLSSFVKPYRLRVNTIHSNWKTMIYRRIFRLFPVNYEENKENKRIRKNII